MASLWNNPRSRLLVIAALVMLIVLGVSAWFVLRSSGGFSPIRGAIVYLADENIYQIGTRDDAIPQQINADTPVRSLVMASNDVTLFYIVGDDFEVRQRISENDVTNITLCDTTGEVCEYLLPDPMLERFAVDNETRTAGREFVQFFSRNGGRQFQVPIISDGDIRWLDADRLIYRHAETDNLHIYTVSVRDDANFRIQVQSDDWALTPDGRNLLLIDPTTQQPTLLSLDFETRRANGQLAVPIPAEGVPEPTYTLGEAIWHPNQTHIAISRSDNSLLYLDPFVPEQARVLVTEAACPISAEDWHPNGRYLLVTLACADGARIQIVDLQDGTRRPVRAGTMPRWLILN